MTDYEDALVNLRSRMARLDEAREQVRQAEAALAQARDEAELAVMRAGAARWREERPFPLSLVRELYWDYPEIRVKPIGRAFGMGTSEVYRRVGPDQRPIACRGGCGATVQRDIQSRTDASRSWFGPNDTGMCDPCRDEALRRGREADARWQREWAQMEDEAKREEEALRRAVAGGLRPASVNATFPGFEGEWAVDPSDVAVRLTDEPAVDTW